MTEGKAAPAPYTTVEVGTLSANGSFHAYIVDRDGRKIAAVWGPVTEKVWTAALLAAAPDMLAALIALEAAVAAHIKSNGEAPMGRDGRQRQTIGMIKADHSIVDALPIARAAIAKATGTSA